VGKLWVNAGHGTLGWTHGAGSGRALAELMSGKRPALDFGFCGPKASSPAGTRFQAATHSPAG
jgi:D-amino-acid dehydrogenase